MSPRAALVALATLLSVVALTGCGLEGQPFTTTEEVKAPEPAEELVTPEALADIPENSLRGVVLRWWRGVQTRDSQVVIKSYTPEARDEFPARFADALILSVSPPASKSSIRVNSLEPTGDGNATVYLTIYSADSRLDGPLAVPMKKLDDKWRIDDPAFLEAIVSPYVMSLKQQAQTAEGGK